MSAAEFAFWAGWRLRHGYPSDRLEFGVAIAGASVCRTLGAKPTVADLLPQFVKAEPGNVNERLRVYLSGVKRAKIRRIPKNGEPYDVTPKDEAGERARPKRTTRRRLGR